MKETMKTVMTDDDDDEGKPENKNDKRAGRLKTPNEKFFEDL